MSVIKIIVATHKQFVMPQDKELYLPIHVGCEGKKDLGFQGDNTGDNISVLNPYYCELTGLYWAWKNLECDYLGLVHYRRYFTKKAVAYKDSINIDAVILDKDDVEKMLEVSNVIVPKKRKYYIETLYSHYAHTLDSSHLDLARKMIEEKNPEYLASFDKVMMQRSGYMFNMFIMKKELLDGYCSWLFPILFELQNRVDVANLTVFEARLFGRVSELLFNVWLEEKKYKVKEVPFFDAFEVDWLKKGGAFLKAKFFKKKYKESF